MGYSLGNNTTYNLNYNNTASYTTGGELPPSSASAPTAGTMMINNGATVVMGHDGTFFSLYIGPATQITANTIFRMAGHNLNLTGYFINDGSIVNTTGLDASGSTSTLTFSGNIEQYIEFGNQVFSNVLTLPNVVVNNTNNTYGTQLTYQLNGNNYGAINGGTWSINNLTVNSGAYFEVGYNGNGVYLNVAGNISNAGTIFAQGNNTYALITMNGTSQQSITGLGDWEQRTTSPTGVGMFLVWC